MKNGKFPEVIQSRDILATITNNGRLSSVLGLAIN